MAGTSELGKRLTAIRGERERQDAQWRDVWRGAATLGDGPIDVPRDFFSRLDSLVPAVRFPAYAVRG